ncbi:MAG: hypothetical protein LUD50_00740 [Clostridia bacterium]|nr:hypothetical protein [Clostridia bacterium]
MKKTRLALLIAFIAAAMLCLCFAFGCSSNNDEGDDGSKDTPSSTLNSFTGITFEDATYTYDGTEKTIEISGTLPTGATVTYTNNTATNEGVYNATATLVCDGYNTTTLNATLTIKALTFTGITLDGYTGTYNGDEHTIAIATTGELPDGATVAYTVNDEAVEETDGVSATNAGTYEVTATITCAHYDTLVLTATLTIEKADIKDIELQSKYCIYSEDTLQTLVITGALPTNADLTVEYRYYKNDAEDSEYTTDGVKEAGLYRVVAVISGDDNYNPLELEATITVVDIANLASSIVGALTEGSVDPWSYLPTGLQMETLAYTSSPVDDYSSAFVDVSSIGTRFIGLQLNVLYTMLSYANTAMGYIDTVNALGATIASGFQDYINENPTDYNSYTAKSSIGGFAISVILEGDVYALLAGNSVVSIEMYYDTETGYHTGRVQLTDGVVLSYTYYENYLQMDLMLTVGGYGAYYELAFLRTDETTVSGYVYESLGSEDNSFTSTAAIIMSYEDYTYVMSTKRESSDLIITGYEEIYNSKTGDYLGAEVTETVELVDYDTYWFNLSQVSGITSIMIDESGSVYLNNNSTTAFAPTKNKVLFVETSRRYDIETKTVYYIVQSTDDEGNITYTKVEAQVPMIFVQSGNTDTFSSDIVSTNSSITFTTTPTLPSNLMTAMTNKFSNMLANYNNVLEQITNSTVSNAIGEKSSLFDNQKDVSTDGD